MVRRAALNVWNVCCQTLTRKERAEKVKKRNYFAKYGEQARAVLEALLEKYADHGITDIEDPAILELPPFSALGTKTQIRRGIFGSNEGYSKAITELEQALYERQVDHAKCFVDFKAL